jgi:hypothetical protein
MKRSHFALRSLFVFGLVAPLLATGSALSFPTGTDFTVRIEGSRVGTFNARNRVVDNGDSCVYTMQWSIRAGALMRTQRCDLVERKASNAFDCESNRSQWVTTLMERTGTCRGFDEFGQSTTISTLIAGESSSGLSGIMVAESIGDVQEFTVR